MPTSLDAIVVQGEYVSQLCEYAFLHPNVITTLAVVASLTLLYLVHVPKFTTTRIVVMIVLLFARAYLDCLDGAVARRCNKTSRFGAAYDMIADYFNYFVLAYGLFYVITGKVQTSALCAVLVIIFHTLMLYVSLRSFDFIYDHTQLDKANIPVVTFAHNHLILFNMIVAIVFIIAIIGTRKHKSV